MPGLYFGNQYSGFGGSGYSYQPPKSNFSADNLPQSAMGGIKMFNPNGKMMSTGKQVGYGNSGSMLANNLNKQFLPQKAMTKFNPYAVGSQLLGQIGGGQRANIGDNVWETGGQLSGTDVGNAADMLGDVAGNFGPVGAIAGLGLKGASDIANLIGYDPEVTDINATDQFMAEGGPILQIGDKIGAAGKIEGNAKKLAGQGALAGAKTGGSIGTLIAPGLGTAIGAGIGALGGFLLGDRKKQKAMDAYSEAMQEIDDTTMQFNKLNMARSQEEFGQERLAQRMTRERNPYLVGYNSPFTV